MKIPMLTWKLPLLLMLAVTQAVLHRTSDFDAGRILDIPQLTGKPGECDLAFYFSGSVHWDSGSAPDSKRSTWENQ